MALNPDLIVRPEEEEIQRAAKALHQGHLVVMPTETVYGLAADACNPLAVSKIFEAKKRPTFDPLICHITSNSMLHKTAAFVPDVVHKLVETFWPGPLTVVLDKHSNIPDIVSSGLSTVAVRMPSHPIARKLIDAFGGPLAAPSANMFGKLSPTRAEHTLGLDGDIASILDGGPCAVGLESTIIRYHDGILHLLRPGGITAEELEHVSGLRPVLEEHAALPEAPGQLASHYAPHAPVVIINEGEALPATMKNSCLITFSRARDENHILHQEILAPDGDLHTAAARLFELLHLMDSYSPETIIVEKVPMQGLGLAIMNRLTKSAAPRV